jgi:cytochrome P450
MAALLDRKRAAPAEDVLSDLAAAQARGDLGQHEAVGYAVALLFAGHETTVTRIDYGTLLLLANPDQRERLLRQPDLVHRAVEEILRASGGVGLGLPRYARADIQIGGVTIRAGEAILLSVAGANHDPAVFAEPDRFDVSRERTPTWLSALAPVTASAPAWRARSWPPSSPPCQPASQAYVWPPPSPPSPSAPTASPAASTTCPSPGDPPPSGE